MPEIRIENVSKSFGTRPILRNVSLHAPEGRAIALCGPSGAGKTTLLRLIAGFERPDSGKILLGNTAVCGNGRYIPPGARGVGMVFQDFGLWPHMRAWKHIDLVLRPLKLPKVERRERAFAWLERVDLANHADAQPGTLSGGEQQRLAIARALAPEPAVLLLDEPLSFLDTSRADRMCALFHERLAAGATIVMAAHDRDEAGRLADQTVFLESPAD